MTHRLHDNSATTIATIRNAALTVAVPFCAALLALQPGSLAHADAAQAEAGRLALDSRCSRCHAIGLDGESPHAEAPPFREIVKRYAPENLEEALAEGIVSGHPDMPEFVLAAEEIGAIIAYLNTLTTP